VLLNALDLSSPASNCSVLEVFTIESASGISVLGRSCSELEVLLRPDARLPSCIDNRVLEILPIVVVAAMLGLGGVFTTIGDLMWSISTASSGRDLIASFRCR